MSEKNPVRVLSPDVARKIAAGEVIDRPAAVVRELLDNAIDSGATSIKVEIKGGGIDLIKVCDNGNGMTKADLLCCAKAHATSKIKSAEDLSRLSTLGFRGEALASIAAVSCLTIASGTYKARIFPERAPVSSSSSADFADQTSQDRAIEKIAPVQNGIGTIVTSERLFEDFPARRVFLKKSASEYLMCKDLFIEKALPKPEIAFRLTRDGELKLDLPSGVSLAQRFTKALSLKESPSLFRELKRSDASKGDWSFTLLLADPAVFRTDRKHIFIYVNGRRVQEFSLVQAIEYGAQGFFPNGTHPVATLFVDINPALVDFNIHPAKKEVRFKDISSVHHEVSSTVRNFYRACGIRGLQLQPQPQSLEARFAFQSESKAPQSNTDVSQSTQSIGKGLRSRFFDYEKNARKDDFNFTGKANYTQQLAALAVSESSFGSELLSACGDEILQNVQTNQNTQSSFLFVACVLNCFIIVRNRENNTLYFIDQHAAHERVLFDKIIASQAEKQALLVPYVIETGSEEKDDFIKQHIQEFLNAGFTPRQTEDGKWEFSTVPARWKGSEENLESAIASKLVRPADIIYSLAAMTACKAAVKDGGILDDRTAEKLALEALALKDPHCPHGRPVWTELSKDTLFSLVKRT